MQCQCLQVLKYFEEFAKCACCKNAISFQVNLDKVAHCAQKGTTQNSRLEKLIISLQDITGKFQAKQDEVDVDIIESGTGPTFDDDSKEKHPLIPENIQPEIDPVLVQIKANKLEIDRRIAAFIEKKQTDTDESNLKEFCTFDTEEATESTCARTSAIFVPRAGCTSHVKVSKVVNPYGPQTRQFSNNLIHDGRNVSSGELSENAIDERLRNMESHTKLDPNLSHNTKKNLYDRIKSLENRILFLESISPEYFNILSPPMKKQRIDYPKDHKSRNSTTKNNQDLSMEEMEDRIKFLRNKLKPKAKTTEMIPETKNMH